MPKWENSFPDRAARNCKEAVMSQIKKHHKLGFPGMQDKRYQLYRAQLLSSERAEEIAVKAAKRGAAKPKPLISNL